MLMRGPFRDESFDLLKGTPEMARARIDAVLADLA